MHILYRECAKIKKTIPAPKGWEDRNKEYKNGAQP